MATQLKERDAVQVVDREATTADEKAQTFFNHYRNLTGVLEKIYDDGLATVVVDQESLPEEIKTRHSELTDVAKKKWLESLSNEARNKLTPEEKEFKMRYSILVETQDIFKLGGKPQKPKKEAAEKISSKSAAIPESITAEDLAKKEEEMLQSRQAGKQA